jgi:hypothetical protein
LPKYKHGGREDQRAVHVAVLLTGLLFFYKKDVLKLTPIERMVAAGMTKDCAAETAMWYMAQGNDDGLEKYVTMLEARNALHALQSESCG